MITDTIHASALSRSSLLVSLNISQWQARKLDRNETANIEARHGNTPRSARVNKSLLPACAELDKVHRQTGRIRQFYYSRTLPWTVEGVNILHCSGYLPFMDQINLLIQEWEGYVADFLAKYPQLVIDAQLRLNGLYRADDYPAVEDVRRKFSIRLHYSPVPTDHDWRVSLDDTDLNALKDGLRRELASAQADAMRAAWERLHELVHHTHERLADPDATFRDSLIKNVNEMVDILPGLNITNDPDLAQIGADLRDVVHGKSARRFRNDASARSEAAAKLNEIMSRMGGMY